MALAFLSFSCLLLCEFPLKPHFPVTLKCSARHPVQSLLCSPFPQQKQVFRGLCCPEALAPKCYGRGKHHFWKSFQQTEVTLHIPSLQLKQLLMIHEFGPIHSLRGNAPKLKVMTEEYVTVGWDCIGCL